MTQPKFAPIAREDEVRPSYRLEPPEPWRAHRPGDLVPGARTILPGAGIPGPDQGYGLGLAKRFTDKLVLRPGEHVDDVLAGAFAIGMRRASLYGRAPVSADIELPLVIFGYLASCEDDLAELRHHLFAGVAHSYDQQRSLAARIPESTLRMKPADVAQTEGGWRALVGS